MANPKKKFRLRETDLARAATAPASRKKVLITQATAGTGYDYYRGVRSNLGPILNVVLPLVSGAAATREQTKDIVGRACNNGQGEIKSNQGIAVGLWDYVTEHKVTAADLDLEPVALGLAGRRRFWNPYILKIDGKRYIPFFDFRGDTRLAPEGRRFVFSVNHAHIRLANPTEYRDVGFVIFQFDRPKDGTRKAVPHFDDGISFWSSKEIGQMIDDVYRVLAEIREAA